MNPIFKFEGIYTPVVTPYHEDGSVNWDALSDVIEYLIASGVHGLISGGSTGENYAQTVPERIELARFTKDQLKGRLPLVVGTGAMLTSDSVALASAASSDVRGGTPSGSSVVGAAAVVSASAAAALVVASGTDSGGSDGGASVEAGASSPLFS